LKAEYSIFWLLVGIVLLILSIFKGLLDILAKSLGVFSPPIALFIVGFGFVVVILLYLSVLISELSSDKKEIFKEISILKWKIEKIRKEINDDKFKK